MSGERGGNVAKSSSGRRAAGWEGRFVVPVAAAAVAVADVDVDVGVAEEALALLLGFTAVVAVEAPNPPPLLLPPPLPRPPPRDGPFFFFFAALLLFAFPLAAPRAVEEWWGPLGGYAREVGVPA